jgi:maltose-binding protein MalE
MLLALLLLLIACSSTLPAAQDGTAGTADRRITLVFWHAWPSPEQHILTRLVDHYNQANPNIQILPQPMPIASLTSELRTAALVGGGPHLVLLQSHTIGALAEDGLLLPLDDSLITSTERERLLSTALDAARARDSDGTTHLYGLPLSFDTLGLYYHTGVLPEPPTTTEMMLDHAHDLTNTSGEPPVWGLAYTLSFDKTIGYLPAFGGQIYDEQGNLVLADQGRAGTEQWLEWLLQLRQDEHILAVNDSIAVDSALAAQEAFMTIDWAHALPRYHTLWGDNLGIAPLPILSATDAPPQPYVQSDVLSINARVIDTAEQQAALDFARYLLSTEAQQTLLEMGKQPALVSLSLSEDTPVIRAAQVFRAQARQGQAMPNSHFANEILHAEITRMQLSVLRGLVSPADAITATEAVLREQSSERAAP